MGVLSKYLMGNVYLDVKILLRYKSTAFWILVFPVIFLGLMTLIFATGESPEGFKLAVFNTDTMQGDYELSKALIDVVNNTGIFTFMSVDSTDELREMVANGTADVGLLIPENFTENATRFEELVIIVYGRQDRPGIPSPAAQALVGVLTGFEDNMRMIILENTISYIPDEYKDYAVRGLKFLADPLKVEEVGVSPPLLYTKGGMIAYYVVSVIGIQALFTGLSMGATLQIERRRDGTLKMLLASPLSPRELFIADIVDLFFFTGLSMASVILAGAILGAEYGLLDTVKWAGIIALTLIAALFSSSLGLILSLKTKTIEGASLLINAVAFPTMFLGGLTVPKEILPGWAQVFAETFPLTRLVDAMRGLIVYGHTLGQAVSYAFPAILASLLLVILGWITYRKLMQIAVEIG